MNKELIHNYKLQLQSAERRCEQIESTVSQLREKEADYLADIMMKQWYVEQALIKGVKKRLALLQGE